MITLKHLIQLRFLEKNEGFGGEGNLGQFFGQGFLAPKIQCTVLLGRRNTVYSSTGAEKKTVYYSKAKNPKLYFR